MSAKVIPTVGSFAQGGASKQSAKLPVFSWEDSSQRHAWIATAASALALVWAYWMMLTDAAEEWSQPQYSHGWVLPLLALYMMWRMRPNKEFSPQVELGLRVSAGVGVALVAAGWSFESLGFLQGFGLAVVCLGVFATNLWGQPFAPLDDGGAGSRYSHPEVMWGIAGVGGTLACAGVFGLGLGPLRPEMMSWLGLGVMILGLVLAAVVAMPTSVVTWHEVAVGTLVILVATLVWTSGVHYDRMPLARSAFIASGIGVLAVVGGMRLVRWVGAPIAFVMFMFPLPQLAERYVLGYLQTIAVVLSQMVYTLIGVSAVRVGNQIELPGVQDAIQMEIAEACSGLSMTNILIAMVVAMVILMDRPWWDRLILLISAFPIAIISNVFRIVLTGLVWMTIDHLYSSTNPEFAASLRDPIHTWLGLVVMMPFALGLMFLELKLLSMLSVPETDALANTQVAGRGAGVPLR